MDALLVELAPAPHAPPAPPRDLAPGPVQAQSEPRPAPAPSPEPAETPPAPTPLVERVALDNPAVTDRAQQPASATASREPARDAAEATAPPSVDARVHETMAAPRDMSGDRQASVESWHGALLAHLKRHRRYPRLAERRNEQGVSYVRFEVDPLGQVSGPVVARSSGNALLDTEALETVRRASPVPPPPEPGAGGIETVVVPVEFYLAR
ncbi:energy transducer TonB [Luteimonas deserti]|uniref:Energy transducer TonB n=1 Tax=Luteimonas deserti TaxID=2752306 RepID=A0A7Z0QUT9_9GAMM|nr:energy transducer TonB [Luteimonas deserti]NYZ64262.1 energy transducer TonB [Luteimonas deserti]